MEAKKDKWRELQERINETIEKWRQEHREATLTEIGEAVDGRVAEMRTQMVQDLAQAGRSYPGNLTHPPRFLTQTCAYILQFDYHAINPESPNWSLHPCSLPLSITANHSSIALSTNSRK